jgi:hypothetical protein
MADMDGVFQVEMLRKCGEIVGVMIHVVAIAGLRGTTMAAKIVGDHAIALAQKETATGHPNHRPITAIHG